ncbi:hypothetical protein ABC977_01975 [Thioalkalicoccus limnaeus]|uniref:Uncharacterized protein n=1 Tax=Thioalkalicoccus limnaeus TaxID=120681 RepID=A0ABV4BFN1_9GAMM
MRSLVADLRRGVNLVIGLPRWGPEGLAQAVAHQLRDDDLLSWRPLSVEGLLQEEPLRLLARRYAPDVPERRLCDPSDLVDSQAFSGGLIWVTGLEDSAWAAWKALLEGYASAVRRRAAEDRGLLCLVVSGMSRSAFPKEDVALSVRLWQDAVTELDMLAWLHYLMGRGGRNGNAMRRRLQLRHALELVAFDSRLAWDASSKDLEVLAVPAAWLAGVAAARGWTSNTDVCWEEGTCDTMEGRLIQHPALVAMADRAEANLGRLLWRAQVGVLFPFLEEARSQYLTTYQNLLRVPHDTGHGSVILERWELEIGHIHHQLRRRIEERELHRLRLLRDVRNALAHHEPLAPDLLQDLVGLG